MNHVNKNILYLILIQGCQYIIPLLTFPYLTRYLGATGFGELAFCLGLTSYISMVSQYGFDLTATGKVASIRDNLKELTGYFWSVIFAKLLLALISTIIFFSALQIFQSHQHLNSILYAMIPGIIGGVFYPNWFYQGLEKMKVITFFTLFSRLITTCLIFILVKNKDDVWLAALLQSSALLLSAIFSLGHILLTKKIKGFEFQTHKIIKSIKDGWHVFLSMVSYNLYTNSPPVIIGIMLGPVYVGYYSAALTIRNSLLGLMNPIYQSIYPRTNYLIEKSIIKGMKFIKTYFITCCSCALFASISLFLLSKPVIDLLAGKGYEESYKLFEILCLTIFINVCSNFYGAQTLLPLGYKNIFSKIVIICGLVSLMIICVMLETMGIIGAAYALLTTELLLLFSLYIAHIKKKINIFKGTASKYES